MRTTSLLAASATCAVAGLASAQPVVLQNATATFSQTFSGNFFASTMIDGSVTPNFGDGWAVFTNGTTSPQTAALETAADLSAAAIIIDMAQVYGTSHTLGRFRFSVTTDDRATFCDGLQTGGDVGANWTVIEPSTFTVPDGVTVTLFGDGSLLIGGANPTTANYSGYFALPLGGITGLRLEVMADPSLPFDGPGRHPNNGNFVLTELSVTAVPSPSGVVIMAMGGLLASRRRR